MLFPNLVYIEKYSWKRDWTVVKSEFCHSLTYNSRINFNMSIQLLMLTFCWSPVTGTDTLPTRRTAVAVTTTEATATTKPTTTDISQAFVVIVVVLLQNVS